MEDDIIQEGKYVVVQKVGGETYRVVRFTRTSKILVEKLRFECDGCLGHPYGLFEVSAMNATPISAEKRLEELRQSSGDLPFLTKNGSSTEETDALKTLVANQVEEEAPTTQSGQEVTQTEVLDMKTGGTRTTIIVDKLVQGNKRFANRTDYSQSKYISRKMKKHSDRILVMKPTIRLLASSYYTKDTEKFGMLRINQLGLLLQMGHIVHNRNVLVIDQLQGIVTAAILERLAGNGACIQVHRGLMAQSVPCLHAMNFDEETLAPYLPVRIRKLLGISDDGSEVKEEEMETGETTEGSLDKPMAASTTTTEDVNVKRAERIAREQRGLGFIASGVDSLILACRSIDVVDCLRILFPKLKPSGAVAIYHNDLQTLVRAQSWLMDNNCLNVALSEQMHRVHQVLPDRTHPMMTQHIASGYVLSGIKVLPAAATS